MIEAVTFTQKGLHELGDCLRDFRESRNWSMRKASEYISSRIEPGLSASAIGELEKGTGKVKAETLLMLAQVGYGGMTFTEMMNIITDRRLALCESGSKYVA